MSAETLAQLHPPNHPPPPDQIGVRFSFDSAALLAVKCIWDPLQSAVFYIHQYCVAINAFLFYFKASVETLTCVCVSEGEGKEGVHILQGARGGSRQCKSLPVCHLTPAGVMLWHIGKWGGRVDEDFNRILKRVMVAFMCVIVTYPKVTALKRHHPSPACLPHASFCLTDSLKLCLFVCSQSHFHLWRSWAKRGDDCTLGGAVLGRTRGISSF